MSRRAGGFETRPGINASSSVLLGESCQVSQFFVPETKQVRYPMVLRDGVKEVPDCSSLVDGLRLIFS